MLVLSSCNYEEKANIHNTHTNDKEAEELSTYDDELGYAINEINFPDAYFRNYILDNIDKDNNLYISNKEIDDTKEFLFISGDSSIKKIKNLKGINIFSNLEKLECNSVEYIDVLTNPFLSSITLKYCNLDEIVIDNNNCEIIDVNITGHHKKLIININNSKGRMSIYDQPQYDILDEVFAYKDGECVFYKEGYIDHQSTFDNIEVNENNEDYTVRINRTYFLGSGTSDIEDGKIFEHDDELLAYEYGDSGNKWYRIDSIYPTEKEMEALPDSSFTPGLEQLLIKYRIRVFDNAPFE